MRFAKAVNHKDADQNITPGQPEDVAAKVAAGEADLGASSLTTDGGLEGVTCTEPYLHADYAVLTKMGAGLDSLEALAAAEAPVVAIQDEPAIASWVAELLPQAEVVPSAKDYAFIVAAGNDELAATINDALGALKADGSYDELYDNWFGDAPEAGTATRPAGEAVQDSTGA